MAKLNGASGFIGTSQDLTAHFYGMERGTGTMPHALFGYAGSTLRAAQMFVEAHPKDNLTVLVDYYGREFTTRSRCAAGGSTTSCRVIQTARAR